MNKALEVLGEAKEFGIFNAVDFKQTAMSLAIVMGGYIIIEAINAGYNVNLDAKFFNLSLTK